MSLGELYLDHAATSPLRPEAAAAMAEFAQPGYGNPSSLHRAGQHARAALTRLRRELGQLLNQEPQELYITSGGTEANHLALWGWVQKRRGQAPWAWYSPHEHPSVQRTLEQMQAQGLVQLEVLPLDPLGQPQWPTTAPSQPLLQVQMALANETGHRFPPPPRWGHWHCDLVQGALLEEIAPYTQAESFTLSSHKLGGPRGVGLLKAKPGSLAPVVFGGGQEQGLRPGTENLAGIAGMTAALRACRAEAASLARHCQTLKEQILAQLPPGWEPVPGTGPSHILALLAPQGNAQKLLYRLDQKGIQAASGSACASGNPEPSPALLDMGLGLARAEGLMRFSFSLQTPLDAASRLIAVLQELHRG